MGYLQAILGFLTALPDLIDAFKNISAKLSEIAFHIDRANKLKEMEIEIQKAKTTKDTSGLEKIFNPGATPSGTSGHK